MNKILSKYIPILFVFLSVLFLLYVFYKAEYLHHGSKAYYYKIYYIIGIISLFFSFINFCLNKELKRKTSIIILSTIFSFYLIECFLLISGLGKKEIKTRADMQIRFKKDPNFDTRSRIEIYEDMKIKNRDIVLAVYPKLFLRESNQQFFQLSGISNKKTILCNEGGQYAIYQSDRYGFNNPDKEWDKKQVAFFLVGDSFIQGYCVNEKDTIGGNIRKKNKVGAVLSLGYGNNGPLIIHATLREYLPLTNTKKVLWFYLESRGKNLNKRLNREINNFILQNYLNNKEFSQNLPLKQNDIDAKLKKFLEKEKLIEQQLYKSNPLLRFIKLSFFRRYTTEKISFTPVSPVVKGLEKLTEIISLSKSFTQKQGAKFYFIYIPHPSRYRMEELFDSKVQVDLEKYIIAENNTPDFKNYEKIINSVKNLDIPVIDIYKELHLTLKDPVGLYPFRLPGHYNELGYKLIVETVLKKIEEYDRLE